MVTKANMRQLWYIYVSLSPAAIFVVGRGEGEWGGGGEGWGNLDGENFFLKNGEETKDKTKTIS